MRSRIAIPAIAGAVAGGIVLFTACTSSPTAPAHDSSPVTATATTSTQNSGPVNAVDAAFVATLTDLGTQDVTMAGFVAGHASHTQLTAIAATIRQHAVDLDDMRAWMARWARNGVAAAPVASGIPSSMIQAMSAMHGATFDDAWLEHMSANYNTAIGACQYELAHGTNPAARQLAHNWMDWMHDQFGQMQQWHAAWMHDGRFPVGTVSATPARPGAGSPVPRVTRPPMMPSGVVPTHHWEPTTGHMMTPTSHPMMQPSVHHSEPDR